MMKSQSSSTPSKQPKGENSGKRTCLVENLADQVLKRGVRKVAEELRGKNQSVGERDQRRRINSSLEDTGVRGSYRQTESKEL